MKVIIAGSRTIKNLDDVVEAVRLSDFVIDEVVSGTARGADQLGEQYADILGIPIKRMPADWNKYGRSAGIKRNEEMGKYADALVAIWDGRSKGARHMIDFMTKIGKPNFVYIVKW
jgi:hypothetical protein